MYGAGVGVAERAIVAPRLPALKRSALSDVSFGVPARLALAGAVLVVALALVAVGATQTQMIVERISTPGWSCS